MTIEDIKSRFNTSTETYDVQRRFFIPCFDDYYKTGIELLSHSHPTFKAVLDLGAGTGVLSKFIYEKYPSAQYVLVDVAEQMLDIAKLRFKSCDNFKYEVADYLNNFPQGEYDLITSALSIHHLTEDEKYSLYTNIYERLPQGGYLLNLDQFNMESTEMNDKVNDFWYNQIKQSGISEKERQLWLQRRELDKENTISETLNMLRKVGFKQVDCIYQYLKFGAILAIK